ncbi:MAG: alpha/beta fold hydrolase [Anaerolineae bacterium]|nr:alpha/beta fold hydrolase [Anaerolineae bacterium]
MPWPYQTHGDPLHPPVLFLHGFLGAGDDWLRVVGELSRSYFCVLPDLPGHGGNIDQPLTTPLSFDTLNNDLFALLEHLQLPRAHLVGYSMGGRTALNFAVHHPDRVASLTLENASPGITDPDERRARAAEDDHRAASIRTGGGGSLRRALVYPATIPFSESASHGSGGDHRPAQGQPSRLDCEGDLRPKPGPQTPVWDRLSRLKMPVMFVAGALDEKYAQLGKQIIARIPHARLAIIPEAGHNVHLEQPERFANLVHEFLTWADTIPTL